MKVTEQYFPVELFAVLYNVTCSVVLTKWNLKGGQYLNYQIVAKEGF